MDWCFRQHNDHNRSSIFVPNLCAESSLPHSLYSKARYIKCSGNNYSTVDVKIQISNIVVILRPIHAQVDTLKNSCCLPPNHYSPCPVKLSNTLLENLLYALTVQPYCLATHKTSYLTFYSHKHTASSLLSTSHKGPIKNCRTGEQDSS